MPEATTEPRSSSVTLTAAIMRPIDEVVGRLYDSLRSMTQLALCTEQYAIDGGTVHLRSFIIMLGGFGIEIGVYAIRCPRGLSITGMLKFGRYAADYRQTQEPIIGLQIDYFPARPEENTVLNGVLAWRKDIWPESNAMLSLVRCSDDGKLIAQDDVVTLAAMLVRCQSELAGQFSV